MRKTSSRTLATIGALTLATFSLSGCAVSQEIFHSETANPGSGDGNYYHIDGKSEPVAMCPEHGFAYTGTTDAHGRIGAACGIITGDTIDQAKARGRQSFAPGSDPAGWGHNDKVEISMGGGKLYHGYMYNRSHLIADSLGGDPTHDNLITGTRTQNVGTDNKGGMAHSEVAVRDFYKNPAHHNCATTYAVTPNYANSTDLIPSTNTVNVKTCDGSIDEKITVYNTVEGYTINYGNGTFSKK